MVAEKVHIFPEKTGKDRKRPEKTGKDRKRPR
jgi:hypothetical protein